MKLARLAVLPLIVGACTDGKESGRPGLVVWELSDAVVVEIGVVGGAEEYQLFRIADVERLAGGDLLVADDGTHRISRFAPDGQFRSSWGREGEGPAEFASLSGLHRGPADSILVVDGWGRRVSVLDPEGEFARVDSRVPYSGDSLFSMDQWLYGRFWISGALDTEARARAQDVLDRLPQLGWASGYLRVLVADDGHLWIREPDPNVEEVTFVVVNDAAEAIALVTMPSDFEPLSVSLAEVRGRWQDASDVEYVRVYGLERGPELAARPAWLAPALEVRRVAPPAEDPLSLVRPAVRALAIAQEMHYSTELTYTSDLDALEWERPAEIEAHVARADERGWVGLFWHEDWDFVCGIGYGFIAPAGWPQGTPACASSRPAEAAP